MSNQKPKSIRDGFGDGLLELGAQNKDVVALSADLRESVRIGPFAEKYPNRFIEVGIGEQNMAGIAAGLALSGRIPYMGTFASFQPMRNLDQIRTSICIMNAPVKIISSHAGFSHAADGIQIQALEDLAIMRALPNMQVVVPADYEQAKQFAIEIATIPSPVYLRLGRSATPIISSHPLVKKEVYREPEIGKVQLLRSGGDGVIFANGYMVDQALNAAAKLQEKGFYFSVINVHTLKPLDQEGIRAAVAATHKVITVEEHQKNGGLGSAVAEVLVDSGLEFRQKMIGVDDRFGQTAKNTQELWKEYGLTVENIVEAGVQLQK